MCDTLCLRRERGALFAKNSDRDPSEAQVLESHPPRTGGGRLRTTYLDLPDPGAAAVLGSRPAWMWGFEHGVNEHRVAIGNERVFTADDPHGAAPALTGMDLVRLGLERSRSADEAIAVMTALLEGHGQGGSGEEGADDPYWSSFLVADPRGAWILETSARSWVARAADDGAAISNRLTLGTDWTRASADVPAGSDWQARLDPVIPTALADVRLAVTRACIATRAEVVDPADVVVALRDHGGRPWGRPTDPRPGEPAPPPTGVEADLSGFSVCMHVHEPAFGIEMTTTASMVVDLPAATEEPVRAWVALGSPCASVYVPVFPADGVPHALGDPATWTRFAALRDRIESGAAAGDGGAALGAVRDALGPVEAELWAAADRVTGDGAVRASFAPDGWRAVDASLTRLGV